MNNYFRGRLAGCGVLAVILVLIGVGFAVYQGVVAIMHSGFSGPFKAQMAAYLAAPQEAPAAGAEEGPKTPGPAKGKMVVLDLKTKDFDWDVTAELPPELKAAKPEEVGTVVQTNWAKTQVQPGYDNGASAYIQECDVVVIDLASRAVIAKQHFQGSDPPQQIEDSSEGVGSKPTQEVVSYLKGLPRG
jgi:hypothetical protein